MRYARCLAALAATMVLAGEAVAQTAPATPNPVTAHYRAYRDAMAAGNLAVAEAEAAAALEASVARDGDGGNTAVLAINLAQARLSLGRRAEAYEPAQRAYAIASGGGSNVDPLMARLVLGRAQLTEERENEGRPMLERALQEGRGRADMRTETYAAAADLGRWLLAREQYGGAFEAWTAAGELVDAAEGDTAYARAEARLGAAAARMARVMENVIREQARPSDTRMSTNAYAPFREADDALAEAQQLMAPYAYVPAEDGGLTLGQRMFANAVGWRYLARTFLQSRGQRPLPDFVVNLALPTAPNARPPCPFAFRTEPSPSFPPGANSVFAVGAAVVRYSVNEEGQTVDVDVAASIPDRWFRGSVEQVVSQWRIETDADSEPGCQPLPILYQGVVFVFP